MLCTIECAFVALKPAAEQELECATSASRRNWEAGMNIVAEAPGFVSGFWGQSIQDPSILYVLVAWKQLDDHVNFTKTAEFRSLHEILQSLHNGGMYAYHVQAERDKFEAACAQPLTSVVEVRFSREVDRGEFESLWHRTMSNHGSAPNTSVSAWTLEELEHLDSHGKVFWDCIGLPVDALVSVDGNLNVVESELRKNIHQKLDIELNLKHVKFVRI